MTLQPIMRPPPQTKFEFFERGWRVVLAWILIILIVVPLTLCIAVVCVSIAYGFLNAVLTGQPLPDLTGGMDRLLTPLMPYIGPGLAGLFALMLSRHREVNTSLGGGRNRIPFEPSSTPPSPTGGLVNNTSIDGSANP